MPLSGLSFVEIMAIIAINNATDSHNNYTKYYQDLFASVDFDFFEQMKVFCEQMAQLFERLKILACTKT